MGSKVFDVVVLGAGPAGLGAALHLAEKGMKVLVLEKNRIGHTQKTWITFDHAIEEYGLEECVRKRFSDIVISCYLGNRYHFEKKDFLYPIDEKKALTLLADRARAGGVDVRDGEAFVNYAMDRKDEGLLVRSSKGLYGARLAVDAMGRYSPILKSWGYRNDGLDMGCLALFLEKVRHGNGDTLFLFDSFFPGSDYFWVVPFEDDVLMAGIFFFSSLTSANAKPKARKLIRYLEARGISGRICGRRMGNIPLGPQGHLSTDRFLCIGDSCNTPLPSSGFSFSRCLEESKTLARFAARYLDGNAQIKDYKKEVLGSKIPGIEVHLVISDMLSKFTDPMLNKAVGAMEKLDEKFLISFLSGRDMSLHFTVTAFKAILNTFTLSEISALSLKQRHMKNMANLYDLIMALPQAKMGEQLSAFVKAVTHNDYPYLAKP